MNRTLASLLWCLVIGSAGAYATDYANLLFFNGIGTIMPYQGDSDTVGLENQVDQMSKRYYETGTVNAPIPLKNSLPKVIIGQSQGGVRALGFAGKYPAQTSAVITIGSPVKGHPMLLNPQTTKNSINAALRTIVDGAANVVPVLGPATMTGVSLLAHIAGFGSTLSDQIAAVCLKFPVLGQGGGADSTNMNSILTMVTDPRTGASPGITDLSPTSDFFKQYIISDSCEKIKLVKVLLGYTTQACVIGNQVPHPGMGWVSPPKIDTIRTPVYRVIAIAYHTTTKKISPGTYVSFIRGTNNDPVTFLDSDDQAAAREAIDIYTKVTGKAGDIETNLFHALNNAAVGYFLCGGWFTALGTVFQASAARKNSEKCYAGRDWVEHYIENVGKILGDSQNDGFIPYSAQSWDLDALGGQMLGNYPTKDFVDNHKEELNDPAIFGSDGGMHSGIVNSDGYLATLLAELPKDTLRPTTDDAIVDGNYTSNGVDRGP